MKNLIRNPLFIICSFLLAAISQGLAQNKAPEPYFSITVSKTLDRPIWWIKPKNDRFGDTPSEVVKTFLKCVQDNDVDGAKKCCSIPPDDHFPQFLEKKKLVLVSGHFERFFDLTRTASKGNEIVISSTPVRGKSGWFRLTYHVKGKNKTNGNKRFHFRQINGTWKIIEPHWWALIVAKDPKQSLHW